MDDRDLEFRLLVERACESASRARIPVHIETQDGQRLDGVPHSSLPPLPATRVVPAQEIFEIDGRDVPLDSIVTIAITAPRAA